jgi:hypothetical protein
VCQNHPDDASDTNVKAVGTSGKRNKDEIAAGEVLMNTSLNGMEEITALRLFDNENTIIAHTKNISPKRQGKRVKVQ